MNPRSELSALWRRLEADVMVVDDDLKVHRTRTMLVVSTHKARCIENDEDVENRRRQHDPRG